MHKLIAYLKNKPGFRDKLPRLHRSLTDKFNSQELTPDVELILLAGLVRDPHEADKLMRRYQAENAPALFAVLPPPRRTPFRERFRRWVSLIEGSYLNDPHKAEWDNVKWQRGGYYEG